MTTLYANDVQANDKIKHMDGQSYIVKSASVDKSDIVLIVRPMVMGALANVVLRLREVDTVELLGHIGQRVS